MLSGFGRPSPPGEGDGCARTGLRGHRLRDANRERASVCQVGLTRVEDGSVSAEDSRYVVPPTGARDFDPWNIRIHHITPDTVARNLPDELRAEVDAVNATFTIRLRELLIARNPDLPVDDLDLAARQSTALFRGALPHLGTVTGDEDTDVAELCTVIDAYLASRGSPNRDIHWCVLAEKDCKISGGDIPQGGRPPTPERRRQGTATSHPLAHHR